MDDHPSDHVFSLLHYCSVPTVILCLCALRFKVCYDRVHGGHTATLAAQALPKHGAGIERGFQSDLYILSLQLQPKLHSCETWHACGSAMISTDCRHVICQQAVHQAPVFQCSTLPQAAAPLVSSSLRLEHLICRVARAILHEMLGQLVSDFWSLNCYHGTSGQYADAHENLSSKSVSQHSVLPFRHQNDLSSDTCHAHFDRGWSSLGHQHRQRSCTEWSLEMTVVTPTKPMLSMKYTAEDSAALLFGAALLLPLCRRHSRPLYGTRPPP